MKTKIIVVCVMLVSFLAGCATNPVTGKSEVQIMGKDWETNVGREAAQEVEKEFANGDINPQLQSYVSSVGQKIAAVSHTPNLKFSFKVIDHNSVNAFALPGGYIFITTGMLKELNTEAQLAAICAHEAIHVTARHAAARISQQTVVGTLFTLVSSQAPAGAVQIGKIVNDLAQLKFSREDEKEADHYGLDYLVKAGYTPYGMVETMEILQKQSGSRPIEFLSTHPNPKNRIGLIQETIHKKGYRASGRVGKEDYNRNVLNNL